MGSRDFTAHSPRCTFEGPGASNTTKIPREDPPKKGAGEGKKARNFGPPPLRAPTRSGPHFFMVWLGFPLSGPHPWGSTFCGTKIQHQKLAEVEIGGSRIGGTRKKKLAEVEIGRSRPRSSRQGRHQEVGGCRRWYLIAWRSVAGHRHHTCVTIGTRRFSQAGCRPHGQSRSCKPEDGKSAPTRSWQGWVARPRLSSSLVRLVVVGPGISTVLAIFGIRHSLLCICSS